MHCCVSSFSFFTVAGAQRERVGKLHDWVADLRGAPTCGSRAYGPVGAGYEGRGLWQFQHIHKAE